MWIAFANRREFLDLIGSKNPDKTLKLRSEKQITNISSRKDEMVLVWRSKPDMQDFLPEMILVQQNDMWDFLAWTSTYLSALRPLTSYCRILEREQAKHLIFKEQKPSLGNKRDAFIGAILGEALSHHYSGDMIRITPTSLKSTYSYVMTRACAMGKKRVFLEDVTKRWDKVRELSQQSKRKITTDAIEKVWEVLRFLNQPSFKEKTIGPSSIILESCMDISKKGVIEDAKWNILTENMPSVKDSINIMRESKEKRVEWFEDMARRLQDSYNLAIASDTASFLCGYLLSQVTRGSMQHAEILRPYLRRFPTVIMWYGLCAGLYKNTGIYNELGGLGSRILRDLQEKFNILERPKADIAFEELEVLFSTEKIDKKFIQENHSYLTVELLPGLHAVVKWPPYEDNGTEKEKVRKEIEKLKQPSISQPSLFPSEIKSADTAISELLAELGDNLRCVQHSYEKLRKRCDQPKELPRKGYSYRDNSRKRRGK